MKTYVTNTFRNFLGKHAKDLTYDYKENLMCYALYIPTTEKINATTTINLKDELVNKIISLEFTNLKQCAYTYSSNVYYLYNYLATYSINNTKTYICNLLSNTTLDSIVSNSDTNETKCYEEAFNESVSAHLGESSWFSSYYNLMYSYEHDTNKPKNVATTVSQYIDQANSISSGYEVDEYRKYGVKRTKVVDNKVFIKYNNFELPSYNTRFKSNVIIIAINKHRTSKISNVNELTECYPVMVVDVGSTYVTFGDVFKIQANANGILYAL